MRFVSKQNAGPFGRDVKTNPVLVFGEVSTGTGFLFVRYTW